MLVNIIVEPTYIPIGKSVRCRKSVKLLLVTAQVIRASTFRLKIEPATFKTGIFPGKDGNHSTVRDKIYLKPDRCRNMQHFSISDSCATD